MRRGLPVSIWAVVAILSTAGQTRGQDSPPSIRERIAPVYPAQAESAGASGDVRVQVTVAADGRASDVRILTVPQVGVGFEEAVLSHVAGIGMAGSQGAHQEPELSNRARR